MCRQCYLKVLPSNGIPFEVKGNKYELHDEYGVGYTSNTNEKFYFDLDDFDIIKNYTWYEMNGYVRANNQNHNHSVSLHALIFGCNCDHINRNRLDNRKSNLRECTQQQNCWNRSLCSNNTSGVAGVSFDKNFNKWIAYIGYNHKHHHLGYFEDFNAAVKIRKHYEKILFGEFAPQ